MGSWPSLFASPALCRVRGGRTQKKGWENRIDDDSDESSWLSLSIFHGTNSVSEETNERTNEKNEMARVGLTLRRVAFPRLIFHVGFNLSRLLKRRRKHASNDLEANRREETMEPIESIFSFTRGTSILLYSPLQVVSHNQCLTAS